MVVQYPMNVLIVQLIQKRKTSNLYPNLSQTQINSVLYIFQCAYRINQCALLEKCWQMQALSVVIFIISAIIFIIHYGHLTVTIILIVFV